MAPRGSCDVTGHSALKHDKIRVEQTHMSKTLIKSVYQVVYMKTIKISEEFILNVKSELEAQYTEEYNRLLCLDYSIVTFKEPIKVNEYFFYNIYDDTTFYYQLNSIDIGEEYMFSYCIHSKVEVENGINIYFIFSPYLSNSSEVKLHFLGFYIDKNEIEPLLVKEEILFDVSLSNISFVIDVADKKKSFMSFLNNSIYFKVTRPQDKVEYVCFEVAEIKTINKL